jgi:hypothetical protein
MSTIYGALGISDVNTTVNTVGQQLIFDELNTFAARVEADLNLMSSMFVQGDTTDHSETYLLPAGGMMQDANEFTRPGAIKRSGELSVAFPIEDARDQVAASDIAIAYMNGPQLDAHMRSVEMRYANWKRFRILKALFNETNETFADPLRGSLTIRRLANGDGTLYPPVIGATAEAQEDHYSGINNATISDTFNPFALASADLSEHFGEGQKVAFINSAQEATTKALTDFYDAVPQYVTLGNGTAFASVNGLPAPGRFIGAANQQAIFVWDYIPAGYVLSVDAAQPAPLKRRLDIPTELQGLQLVATQQEYPLTGSFWRAREGYGAANRLNGVVIHIAASASYTIPALYA